MADQALLFAYALGCWERCLGSTLQMHPSGARVQSMLPALYRGHDCLLFTSKYEAWGMPVSSKNSETALRLRA